MLHHNDESRYIDVESFNIYTEHDGQEVVVDALLPVPVSEAYDQWVKSIYIKGKPLAAPFIETDGSGPGKLGSIRRLTGGIREKIVRVGVPDKDPKCGKIASISYELIGGPFPTEQHIGFVRFLPDSSGQYTYVIWGVKFFPSYLGYVFCCGGPMIRSIVRISIGTMLNSLVSEAKAKQIAQNNSR